MCVRMNEEAVKIATACCKSREACEGVVSVCFVVGETLFSATFKTTAAILFNFIPREFCFICFVFI